MVHKSVRPRGRPRNFDESAALAKAIQVFWLKGYDGVTVDDLVAGMGVGRPSLYSIFGDKRTIFCVSSVRTPSGRVLTRRKHCSRRQRCVTRSQAF